MVSAVAAGSTADEVLSCGEDGACVLSNWVSGEVVMRWNGHARGVTAAQYAPQLGSVFTSGRDLKLCQCEPPLAPAARHPPP